MCNIYLYYHAYVCYVALHSTSFIFVIFLLDLYNTKPFIAQVVVI